MTYANSADPGQTGPGSALLSIPIKYFKKELHKKQNLGKLSMEYSVWNFRTITLDTVF